MDKKFRSWREIGNLARPGSEHDRSMGLRAENGDSPKLIGASYLPKEFKNSTQHGRLTSMVTGRLDGWFHVVRSVRLAEALLSTTVLKSPEVQRLEKLRDVVLRLLRFLCDSWPHVHGWDVNSLLALDHMF